MCSLPVTSNIGRQGNIMNINDDIIDSRDVIARIEELEALGDECEETGEPMDEDDAAELAALRDFAEEASAVSDWQYGEQFIRDSYFEEYAQQLADDIGAIPDDAAWPLTCIDWERAARELRMDYTSYELAGVTYWARA